MAYDVDVNWDDEAGVWYAVCDGIPLAMESNSFDALIVKVKAAARDVLEIKSDDFAGAELCFKAAHKESII